MRIHLPQLNKSIDAEYDANLFKTLKAAEIPIASSCNGDGVCGKCIITIIKGQLPPANPLEIILQKKYNLHSQQRISCQCQIQEDITITTSYW